MMYYYALYNNDKNIFLNNYENSSIKVDSQGRLIFDPIEGMQGHFQVLKEHPLTKTLLKEEINGLESRDDALVVIFDDNTCLFSHYLINDID